MYSCYECDAPFTREDNLIRHKKYHCIQPSKDNSKNALSKRHHVERNRTLDDDESTSTSSDDEMPTFDGAEFGCDKPLRRETLHKMMKMLKIPEHRWERISTDELEYRQAMDTK